MIPALVLVSAFLLSFPIPSKAHTLSLVFTKDVLYEINSDVEDKNILEIKKEVARIVKDLEKFEVLRQGDKVTLNFVMQSLGGKEEFALIGPKLDFYRMAMGVDLLDTLKKLTAHDKRIEALSGSVEGGNIILTLAVGHRTNEKPQAAAKPAQETAEEKLTREYAAALQSNDPDILNAFAAKYPDSTKAPMARKLADRLLADKEWAKLGPNPGPEALKNYIARNPGSKYAIEAERKLEELKKEAQAKQAAAEKKKAEEEAEKKRREAEEETRRAKAAEDKKHQETAKREKEAFQKAKGSIETLRAYVAEYPGGSNVREAETLIAKMQKEIDDELKADGGRPKLLVAEVSAPPVVDGDGRDPAWATATPLNLECEPQGKKTSKTSIEVKAVHSGKVFYIKIRWRDPDADVKYRPWLWDKAQNKYIQSETLDDGVAVSIYEDNVANSCMLQGDSFKADIWLWRALWSQISGKASDQMIIASADRLPRANSYLARTGKGQIWVQNFPDKGKQGWRYDIPFPSGKPESELPSYKADKATGSAGDVTAVGQHKDGYWTVEFSRAFNTGNDDDVALPASGKILASFAVYEKTDRNEHSTSQLVTISTTGR